MLMRNKLVLGMLAVVLSLSFFAVANNDIVQARGNTMVIGIPNEPANLDMHKESTRMTKKIQYFLNDPLIHQDPETMEYVPGLAKDWEVSDDSLEWTFWLRDDVYFHNGDHFTSHDVKWTWERIMDPATGAQAAAADIGPMESIEIIDDYTFKVYFSEPYAPFFSWLAHNWLVPLNQRAVEEYGEDYGQNPVGTGPFKFKEWVAGQHIKVVRNEDYNWGPEFYENQGPPHIEEVEFRIIPEVEISAIGMQTGELDAVDFLADKDVDTLRAHPDIELFDVYLPGVGLYGVFNSQSPLFEDVEVRRAVNHAINRELIINVVKRGNAIPAYGPLPFFFLGYDERVTEYGYPHNVDRANEILDAAGWEMGADGVRAKDGVRLDGIFLVRQRDDYILASQLIQGMLRDIGVRLELQILEWGTLLDGLFGGDHDFGLMGYGTGEPAIMYNYFHSSQIGTFNLAHYGTEELDALIAKGETTIDLDDRADVYVEFQEYVVRDKALWVPLYTDIQYTPVNTRVQNVKMHPLAWFLLNDAKIAD